jgi:antitoxin component of RelBE/YafQ-DinJ toxin-antitoxin module|tara:strand:+ start:9433 stop:9675 length:243 start_codon:yes stop_codon:yes gene_type:complete
MESKLTLKLDRNVINNAKTYAKKQNISLSKLIENYLNKITHDKNEIFDVTPLVESLTGIIDLKESDYRKEYNDFLSEKYS